MIKAHLSSPGEHYGYIVDESSSTVLMTVHFFSEMSKLKKTQIMNAALSELEAKDVKMDDKSTWTEEHIAVSWEDRKQEFKKLLLSDDCPEHVVLWYMQNILDIPEELAKKRYDLGENLKNMLQKTYEEIIDSVYCAPLDFQTRSKYFASIDPVNDNAEVQVFEAPVEVIAEHGLNESEKLEMAELEKEILNCKQINVGMDANKLSRYLELRRKTN